MTNAKSRKIVYAVLAVLTIICFIIGISGFSNNQVSASAATYDLTSANTSMVSGSSGVVGRYSEGGVPKDLFYTRGDGGIDIDANGIKLKNTVALVFNLEQASTISAVIYNSKSSQVTDTLTLYAVEDIYYEFYEAANASGKRLEKANEIDAVKFAQYVGLSKTTITSSTAPGVNSTAILTFASPIQPNSTETIDGGKTVPAGKYLLLASSDKGCYLKNLIINTASYDVSYDAGEGSNAPQSETLPSSTISLVVGAAPTAPTGKVFVGWNDGKAIYQPNDTYAIGSSVNFVAKYDAIISSVESLNAIVKKFDQTKIDAGVESYFGLPATVDGVTVDGTVALDVEWQYPLASEIVLTEGVYSKTITGTISSTAPEGYVYDMELALTVEIDVTLNENATQITSIAVPSQIDALLFDDVEELKATFPTTVEATLSTLDVIDLAVVWGVGSELEELSTLTAGTYELTGVVTTGDDYELATGVSVTLIVVVSTIDIESAKPQTITLATGTDLTQATLPSTVTVIYGSTNEVTLPVVWNSTEISAIDSSVAGETTISGDVDVTNTPYVAGSVKAQLTISLIEITTASFTAYEDSQATTTPSTFDVDWTTVYTNKIVANAPGIVVDATNATSDNAHGQTAPMLKVNAGRQGAIVFDIFEKAKDVQITISAVVYGSAPATISFKNEENVSVLPDSATTLTVSSPSNTDDAVGFVPFTSDTFTISLEKGGKYYLNGESKNCYVTEISVSAIIPELVTYTFETNGKQAQAVSPISVEKNGELTLPAVTPIAGFDFIGWNTQEDLLGTTYQADETISVGSTNETLFAMYSAQVTEITTVIDDIVALKPTLDDVTIYPTTVEAIASLNLPSTVDATLADETPITVSVSWNTSALFDLTGFIAGNYVVNATLTPVTGHAFAQGLSLSANVRILAEKLVITAFGGYEETTNVLLNTQYVPEQTVTATLSDLSTIELDVAWTPSEVNTSVLTGETPITLTGVVAFDEKLFSLSVDPVLTNEITKTINVFNYVVTSIDAQTVYGVAGLKEPQMPTTFVAHYLDGTTPKTIDLEVESIVGIDTINFDVAGSYDQITATLTANAQFTVPSEVTAKLTVIINDYVSASTARSTDFDTTSTATAGSFRGFTFTGTVEQTGAGGQKFKGGSVSFTLTAPADVSIVYSFDTAKSIVPMMQKDNEPSFEAVSASQELSVSGTNKKYLFTATLQAGTYTLSSSSSAGSVLLHSVIIDDGASEVFMAQTSDSSNVALPKMPNKKTVDNVEYTFYGFTDVNGAAIYNTGDEVASSVEGTKYFAIYVKADETTMTDLVGIKIVGVRAIRFQASIKALNASVVNKLIANGSLSFTASLTANEVPVLNCETEVVSADEIKKTLMIDETNVEFFGNGIAFEAKFKFSVGMAVVFERALRTSPKAMAESFLADVKDTATDFYRFEDENGKFSSFLKTERDFLATYSSVESDPTIGENPGEPTEPGENPGEPTDPGEGTTEPGEGTTEPGEGTTEPGEGTTEPGEGTTKPGEGTTEPGEGTTEPGEGTTEPGEGTTEPGEGTTEPGEGTTEPGEGTTEPGEGTTEPGEGTTEPGEGTTEPGEGTTEPGEGTTEPGEGTIEPGEGTTEPGEGTTEPGEGTTEPGEGTTEPGEGTTEPGQEPGEIAPVV